MTFNGWLQILIFTAATIAITKPLGTYLFRVFERRADRPFPRTLGRVELFLLRACGVDPGAEQSARGYGASLLAFSAFGVLVTYAIERIQGVLPWNPQGFAAPSTHLAFNTAVSFVTNTN